MAGPDAYNELPLSCTERYKLFSQYPYIVRDMAMWAAGRSSSEIEKMIREEAGDLWVKISLFDRFEKEGKMSLAYRIIFQSFDRTLTEAEVNPIMAKKSSETMKRALKSVKIWQQKAYFASLFCPL